MKRLSFVLALLLCSSIAYAECLLDCMFSPGTKCVDGVCVPVIVPSPTATPLLKTASIILKVGSSSDPSTYIDCNAVDLKNFKILFKRSSPPGKVSFYSALWLNGEYYYARKDILNRFVFVLKSENEIPHPQFVGEDFKWDTWEDVAFSELFNTLPCSELKKYVFTLGISKKGDMSDYEGASFIFWVQE